MLVDDNGNHGEEHSQQGGKGQRFGKRFTDSVLIGDAAQRRGENNDRKTNQPHLRQMQRQRGNQPHADKRLDNQLHGVLTGALLAALVVVFAQDLTHRLRQRFAIAKRFGFLHENAGEDAADKDRHAHGRDAQQEIAEAPARRVRDNQVLRLTDHRHHAAKRSADARVHHQTAQKRAKALKRGAAFVVKLGIIYQLLALITIRRDAMVDTVKAHRHANHYSNDRQRVEKRGKKRRRKAECQREQGFGANAQQQAGENEQQQLLHKINARHHKNQQQHDGEVICHFFAHVFGAGHPDKQCLDGQQPAGQQRVALQRHRQREDKLNDQQPAGGEGAYPENQRIKNQKAK